MKVKLKDLHSNPWRSFEDYPLVEWKVDALRNSIKAFTFWENLLVRNNVTDLNPDGEFQLAYGHHRLQAAKLELGEDYVGDLAVKELSDETMLKILLEENNDIYVENGKLNVKAFDSGIKQAWEYLIKLSSPDYKTQKKGGPHVLHFKGLPIPEEQRTDPENGYKYSCLAKQIQEWLGENHSEELVHNSLMRLRNDGSIKYPERTKDKDGKIKVKMTTPEMVLDREAVNTMPTNKAAKRFTTIMIEIADEKNSVVKKQGKVSPAKQKKIAKNLAEKSERLYMKEVYSQSSILNEAVRVIDGEKEAEERESAEILSMIEKLQKGTNKLVRDYKAVNRIIEDRQDDGKDVDLFRTAFEKFKCGFAITKLAKAIFDFNNLVGKNETDKSKIGELSNDIESPNPRLETRRIKEPVSS